MIYWIDANSHRNWQIGSTRRNKVEPYALRDLDLHDAEDEQIFQKARQQGIVIISKDSDFVEMVLRLGVPPQLLWVTCGNVTNRRLQILLTQVFPRAQELLASGEAVVEIADLEATKIA